MGPEVSGYPPQMYSYTCLMRHKKWVTDGCIKQGDVDK